MNEKLYSFFFILLYLYILYLLENKNKNLCVSLGMPSTCLISILMDRLSKDRWMN